MWVVILEWPFQTRGAFASLILSPHLSCRDDVGAVRMEWETEAGPGPRGGASILRHPGSLARSTVWLGGDRAERGDSGAAAGERSG